MANEKFWEREFRFECQGTGRCCVSRGGYGHVYFNLEDRRRLARHLGIPTQSFTRRYCRKAGQHFHLKKLDGDCEFMRGKGCAVYEARPNQCRTWPFWPENMNAKTWDRDVKAFCPGVGKGRRYSREEIVELLKLDPVDPWK